MAKETQIHGFGGKRAKIYGNATLSDLCGKSVGKNLQK